MSKDEYEALTIHQGSCVEFIFSLMGVYGIDFTIITPGNLYT